METCENCRFYDMVGASGDRDNPESDYLQWGYCRRHAPTSTALTLDEKSDLETDFDLGCQFPHFPPTPHHQWCGEYQAKE